MSNHNIARLEKDNILVNGVIQELSNDKILKKHSELGMLLSYQYHNILSNNALPIVCYIIKLTHLKTIDDVDRLRDDLLKEINAFVTRVSQQNVHKKTIENAKYVLCAMLDEIVLNRQQDDSASTFSSAWSQNNLVSTFFPDAWGGENFFHILEKTLRAQRTDLDLLELMLTCLNLGFEGKYRSLPRGSEQLHVLRDRLFNFIKSHKRRSYTNSRLPTVGKSLYRRLCDALRYSFLMPLAAITLLTVFIVFDVRMDQMTNPLLHSINSQVSV